MPAAPKLSSFPAIRGALRFYQICSVITGTMLLLLVGEMVMKYAFGLELFLADRAASCGGRPSSRVLKGTSRPVTD